MPEVIVPDPNLDPLPGEVNVLRRQTAQYIKQNQTDVVLNRRMTTPDGAGGVIRLGDHFLNAQPMRIIQASESSIVERRTSDGETVRPDLNMLAMWDADIKEGDRFVWKGYNAEVVYITDLPYERTAEVSLRSRVDD